MVRTKMMHKAEIEEGHLRAHASCIGEEEGIADWDRTCEYGDSDVNIS